MLTICGRFLTRVRQKLKLLTRPHDFGRDLWGYMAHLIAFNPADEVALDRNHNVLLFGALVSRKPESVIEIGVGSGYVTHTLLHGIRYNRKGTLTCVDNWYDWQGREPRMAAGLKRAGANIIVDSEEAFTRSCASDRFDFLVSDGDHLHAGEWIDETLRIVKHDGFMFFHDTNQPALFPSLLRIEQRLRELNLPYYQFTETTRPDERCHRGWLLAINKKPVPEIA